MSGNNLELGLIRTMQEWTHLIKETLHIGKIYLLK